MAMVLVFDFDTCFDGNYDIRRQPPYIPFRDSDV